VQQAALTRWAKATYRAHRVAEKTFTFIAHHAKIFRIWPSKHGVRSLNEPELTLSGSRISDDVASPRHTQMPFGFALQYDESSICRLVYAPSSDMPIDKVIVSNESIAKSMRKVTDLLTVYTGISVVQSFLAWILPCLIALELAWLGVWLMCTCYPQAVHFFSTRYSAYFSASKVEKIPHAHRELLRHVTIEEEYTVFCVAIQLLTMAIHTVVVLASGPESQAALVLGVILVTQGITLLSYYIVPLSGIFSIFTICKTIKCLFRVCHGVWTDPEVWTHDLIGSKIARTPAAHEHCPLLSPITSPQFAPTVSLQGTSLGNELDSVQEDPGGDAFVEPDTEPDFVQEGLRYYASRGSGTQAVFGNEEHSQNASDHSDSESESDAEVYLDIAGGINPTTTDDSDWSVVETCIRAVES
jgi:hypothetical protein